MRNFLTKLHLLLIGGLCLFSAPAFAQEELDNPDIISVYARACEPIKQGEARSSVRVRATDKAAFKSLENISALADIKQKLLASDFNTLVYTLIDNYLEDMAVRTVEHNDENLCVEVTGYLSKQNIAEARAKQKAAKQELMAQEKPYYLELESNEKDLPPVVTGMPPKPQPKIHEEIAFETAEISAELPTAPNAQSNSNTMIFVEKTKFFDGSNTGAFFETIKQALAENPNLATSQTMDNADYILKSEVLRAKVDPINKQTFRLQMVISMELTDTETSAKITEHQNRFLLFESTEDEQKVAASLMKKLLTKGCQQLLPRISAKNKGAMDGSIITPSQNTNYNRN